MYWRNALVVLALIFGGCAAHTVAGANETSFKSVDLGESTDFMVLSAYDALSAGRSAEALKIFVDLFERTKEPAYLKEALKIAFVTGSPRLGEFAESSRTILANDNEALRVIIGYDMMLGDVKTARANAQILLKREPKSAMNHSIMGTVYAAAGEDRRALSEFREAYELEESEENLLKLADILLNRLDRRREALTLAENWVAKNGCGKQTCLALLDAYAGENANAKMIKTYVALYEESGEKDFLQNALSIMIYEKDLAAAKDLLEKYGFNDAALMEVYAGLKDLDKAYALAQKLYTRTQNPEFAARMAIYKYEKAGGGGRFDLAQIVRLFEESVYKLNLGVYYNYYGYLLIDHDIDLQKGLELVLKAHELEPDSPYIIDSVAWGYFKIGKCELAKEWMDKIAGEREFMESEEAKEHKKAIDACARKAAKNAPNSNLKSNLKSKGRDSNSSSNSKGKTK